MIDLRDLEVRRIGGKQTLRRSTSRSKTNLRIDVERNARPAWRPNNRLGDEVIREEIVPIRWAGECSRSSSLCLLAREVVCSDLLTGDARVKRLVAAVVGREERILEALRVVDVEIDLAVLAVVGRERAGPDGCNYAQISMRNRLASRKRLKSSASWSS